MDTDRVSKQCQFSGAVTEDALTQRLLECLVIGTPLKRATRRLSHSLGKIDPSAFLYGLNMFKKTADELLDQAHLLVVRRGGAIPFDERELGIVTFADLAAAKRTCDLKDGRRPRCDQSLHAELGRGLQKQFVRRSGLAQAEPAWARVTKGSR